MKLSALVAFNPSLALARGVAAPFIEMSMLPTNRRDVGSSSKRRFGGSGSRFQDSDTLFARITPCLENGKTARVIGMGDGVVGHGSTEFIVMRAKLPSDVDFIYYLARLQDFRAYAIRHMTGTSGRQRVAWQALAEYEFGEVSALEREAIGSSLGALDDLIEHNSRTTVTLEAMAQAIFRDWFVDFGPVRRKMQGATDAVMIMGGVTTDGERAAQLSALFAAELAPEGQPAGWDWGTADDWIDFNPAEPLRKGTPAPYLEMSALPTSGPTADAPVERPFGSGMRFKNGDALLARITPCLENGKACFVDMLPDGVVGWGSTEFFVLRARAPAPKATGYLLCRDPDFRNLAMQSMTGTSGRQRAQLDMLRAWPMAIPPKPVLRTFATFIEPLFAKIAANAAENRTLAETRDYLLPRLMSGEVRVREAEELAEAAE